ncbi:hypothetical protein GH733_012048 [Mirounga leonina]|nr:hypothetical protein GH733_012048 [Mirounga leonina]
MKCQNTKPYLKAKSNGLNHLPSKSIIISKKDITNHNSKTQQHWICQYHRIQKPKLDPPKLLGKRLTSGCISSNLNWKPSSNNQEQHEAGSFITGELSRKTELKTAKQQVADQGNVKCANSVDNNHVENEFLDGFLKEINKKRLAPKTLSRTQASKKPVVKDIKDIQSLNKKVKRTKPSTCPNVLQGSYSNRHPNIKQDQKSPKPVLGLGYHVPCKKSKALSQSHNLTVGNFNSVIPSTPKLTANGTNGDKCTNSY